MNEVNEKCASAAGRPGVFGEVLFDDFEDGATVIGGAAFNLAWNLESLGLAPLFISRIGSDRLGEQVLEIMKSCGMDITGVQLDSELPTGTVSVRVREGQPQYRINDAQAYDAIDAEEALDALGETPPGILYHGSLALRTERSRGALDALAESFDGGIFVDVNLRRPWWERDQALRDLSRARWAKLNDEELQELSGATDFPPGEILAAAGIFRKEMELDILFLTRGSAGAAILAPAGEILEFPAAAVGGVVDTVGAGDGFTAVVLLGLLRGWGGATILERAIEFAASICSLEGATTDRREHYREFLQRWAGPGPIRD